MTRTRFDTAQLASFAAAVHAVRKIMDVYLHRMSRAANETERQTFEQEGANRVVAAIESEGLRVDVYNAIILAARNDTALRSRIDGLVSEQADQPG